MCLCSQTHSGKANKKWILCWWLFLFYFLLISDPWHFATTSCSTELSNRLHYVPQGPNPTNDPVSLWFLRRKMCIRNPKKWFWSQVIKLFVLYLQVLRESLSCNKNYLPSLIINHSWHWLFLVTRAPNAFSTHVKYLLNFPCIFLCHVIFFVLQLCAYILSIPTFFLSYSSVSCFCWMYCQAFHFKLILISPLDIARNYSVPFRLYLPLPKS